MLNQPETTDQEESKAHEAVRTLIRWAGDDPDRPGMAQTPARVLAFYRAFFTGYGKQATDYAAGIAAHVEFDDFILVRDIALASFCEHHMLPATGAAHIAYIPGAHIAGLGTITRMATDCARRFTTQETLTTDIARFMEEAFAPQGIAVSVTLSHGCMSLRQPAQKQAQAVTVKFTGSFSDNPDIQKRFFMLINREETPDAI